MNKLNYVQHEILSGVRENLYRHWVLSVDFTRKTKSTAVSLYIDNRNTLRIPFNYWPRRTLKLLFNTQILIPAV